MEYMHEWMLDHPISVSIGKYLLWLALVVFVLSLIRRALKRKLPDSTVRYNTQKAIELIAYGFIALLTISYFTGNIKDFTLAIGLLSAGITITLQELILSIAGSFYIFFVGVYKPGDRIEINGIKGDVIDIDSMYTTMMEIGEWVKSDNYSGRIVKLSNAFVFKGPVYNYSMDFPFVWDEFTIPIHYQSNMEKARSIIITAATEILQEYVDESVKKWKEVVAKYYIEDAQVEPTLSLKMTDNWAEFTLRYIVDYKKRRGTKNQLNSRILALIQSAGPEVRLASSSMEIIDWPLLKQSRNEDSST